MSQNYRFGPTKFKRINFFGYKVYAIGLGISLDCWSISIQVPFFVIELSYHTKKEKEKLDRIAKYFSENADLLED